MEQKQMMARVRLVPLKIVGDGLIANVDTVQGRAVPVLIVDSDGREDIEDLFLLHRGLGHYGEATHQWLTGHGLVIPGIRLRPRPPVVLRIGYLKPVKTQLDIEFELPTQAILVEMVLRAECFYLQIGHPGDRVLPSGQQRILIEVLSTGFEPVWKRLHIAVLKAHFKSRKIRGRSKRRDMAEEVISRMVELSELRLAASNCGD